MFKTDLFNEYFFWHLTAIVRLKIFRFYLFICQQIYHLKLQTYFCQNILQKNILIKFKIAIETTPLKNIIFCQLFII